MNHEQIKKEDLAPAIQDKGVVNMNGYWYEYHRKAARHRSSICLSTKNPAEYCNGTFLYSTKDPGSGIEFVVINTNDPEVKRSLKKYREHFKFLPLYFPANRRFSRKLHLAIWNCGLRPQSFWQAVKDIRITIRKNNKPIFVIKKGDI